MAPFTVDYLAFRNGHRRLQTNFDLFHGGESGSIPLGSATDFPCTRVPFLLSAIPQI
jgi:hypothetical protein